MVPLPEKARDGSSLSITMSVVTIVLSLWVVLVASSSGDVDEGGGPMRSELDHIDDPGS